MSIVRISFITMLRMPSNRNLLRYRSGIPELDMRGQWPWQPGSERPDVILSQSSSHKPTITHSTYDR
eukprot:8465020-Prorocentrum_lima.AAC.1